MPVVALTGGIGAGKSTVATMLKELGAYVVDADEIAKRVVEPHKGAWKEIITRFGRGVIQSDETLDRGRLAEIVFSDQQALLDLEAIVHPPVWREIEDLLRLWSDRESTDDGDPPAVAILVLPLLRPAPKGANLALAFDGVAVVDASESICVERLTCRRGMSKAQARARIEAQISRDERLEMAGFVIDNSDGFEELEASVKQLYDWICRLPQHG